MHKIIIVLGATLMASLIGGMMFWAFNFTEPLIVPGPVFSPNSPTSTPFNLSDHFYITTDRVLDKKIADLALTPDNFPALDGATASQPLRALIACQLFDLECTWYENENREMFLMVEYLTGQQRSVLRPKIDVNSKTQEAYLKLIRGELDLVLVSTEPSSDALLEAQKRGVKLVLAPIGWDGFVFLVHKDSPVTNLTTPQIVGIYSGQIKNWQGITGLSTEILAYARPRNSGSQELMEKLVMKGVLMDPDLKTERVIMAMAPLIEGVESSIDSLGYSLYYYKNNMIDKRSIRPNVKLIAVDGVEANPSNIATKKYPYVFPIYAVTRDNQSVDSKAFQLKEWLTSTEAEALIKTSGYISLGD